MRTTHSLVSSNAPKVYLDIMFLGPGLPWWLIGKEFACQRRDMGSVPVLERFSRVGNGNPIQYSCLGHPMEPGGLVHGVTKELDMTYRLNNNLRLSPRPAQRLEHSPLRGLQSIGEENSR